MKMIQVLPTLSYGDGVSGDALAIDDVIKELGCETHIYAQNIDSRLNRRIVSGIEKIPELGPEDIMIYHFSTGTELNDSLRRYPGKKMIVYHNITPAFFFEEYSQKLAELCSQGRNSIRTIAGIADYCWADSEYNRQELLEAGVRCKVDVVPILVPFEKYKQSPEPRLLRKYRDDWVNIIFVGRVAPNKKQEDVIKVFYYYKKYINVKSRLFIVGSYNGTERYYHRLTKYVEALGLEDVFFTGHLKFEELLAYYTIANVFLCMSEHEGFCIPLLEAMYFHVPIVAYNATGVKDTLQNAGIRFAEKDYKWMAETVGALCEDGAFREEVIARQNVRLEDFSFEKTRKKMKECLEELLSSK